MRSDVPLAQYTTLGVGGKARYFISVTTNEEVRTAVCFAQQNKLPFFVLGGGSNILVSDDGYDGVVIHMNNRGITTKQQGNKVEVSVAAGEPFDQLIARCVAEGWWGLENLSAIPGSTGATAVQNVGAYGVEVADRIVSVNVYDTNADVFRTIDRIECRFDYRDSLFKQKEGGHYIILDITIGLDTIPCPVLHYPDLASVFASNDQAPTLALIRDTIIKIRQRKFPDWTVTGTAGSFFKNPIIKTTVAKRLLAKYPELPVYPAGPELSKVSLGYILDKLCGLKGKKKGKVGLYEAQALVLVAERGATANEIETFANEVCDIVEKQTGIKIEREVIKIL